MAEWAINKGCKIYCKQDKTMAEWAINKGC